MKRKMEKQTEVISAGICSKVLKTDLAKIYTAFGKVREKLQAQLRGDTACLRTSMLLQLDERQYREAHQALG